MPKKVRGKRFLLNDPGFHSTAAIVAEIEDTRTWREGFNGAGEEIQYLWSLEPDVTLEIADCDRKITLQVDWESAHERKASVKKLDRMIEALTTFREALVDEQRLYTERLKGL